MTARGWAVGAGHAVTVLLALVPGCMVFRPAPVIPPAAPREFVREREPAETSVAPTPATAAPGQAPQAPPQLDARTGEARDGAAKAGRWWTAFADPALDALIQEALSHNYTIRDLRHLIHEGALDPAIPRGWLWPLQVGIPASIQRVRVPSGIPTPNFPATDLSFTQADVGLTASYQVDLFGQLAVQRQLFEDAIEQQRQNTEVFAQTLAEQITQAWFDVLEQRALIELVDRQIRFNRELLALIEARFEQNLTTRVAVLQQRQQLLDTEAQKPLLEARLALLGSQLGALLGRTPRPTDDLVPPDRRLPDLRPAPDVGAPSDLIDGTPELRLARARVAEIEDQISQNLAGWLPTVEVFGNVGVTSYELTDEFVTGAVGVRLTWPIFDGGRRISQKKQLDLRLERRVWQYELALKTQVMRVQDALVQERKQAESSRTLRAQVDLGRHLLDESRQLFERGLSDYLPVLSALANLSNLERSAIQAQRLLLSYRVSLYHALGGDWSQAATELPAP